LFESGFSLEKPPGEAREGGGTMACEGEGGVNKGIGLDEGAVEIDAESGGG